MLKSMIKVEVNPAEILIAQNDSKDIILNPNAENAIVKLLEIQKEVNKAVQLVKDEIEKQSLKYDQNFTSLKGSKIKINYSMSGAKYKVKGDLYKHSKKFWTKTVSWSLNSKAVDEYRNKFYKTPKGIEVIERKKSIRISEI